MGRRAISASDSGAPFLLIVRLGRFQILEQLPKERQTFLFSATMTSKVGPAPPPSLRADRVPSNAPGWFACL